MLKPLLSHKLLSNHVVRYLLVGGFATGVNYVSRFGWSALMPFAYAVPAAYLTGMAVSFFMYRHYVFPRSHAAMHAQLMSFAVINLLGIAQVWLVSMGLTEYALPALGFNVFYAEAVGHGIAVGVPIFSSYFGHRYLTFRGTHTQKKA